MGVSIEREDGEDVRAGGWIIKGSDGEDDDGGEVLPFVYDERIHLTLEEARKLVPDIKLGETIEEEVTPKDFGRVAAATAKQVVIQKIRS